MQVKRLDLGADVVYVPTRDILVIHPDLDYAEALGAVAGTLPHLHPDAVKSLVDQVTATPRPEPAEPSVWPRVLAQAVVALVTSLLVLLGWGTSTATADGPRWGEIWRAQVKAMGMDCDPVRDSVTTCVAGKHVIRVEGFRHRHADLYLIDRPGPADNEVLVFDDVDRAERWAKRHPEAEQAGRVVIL